ncbi:MAG: hypothetical protein BWY19_00230 [bacterium ADurb.Bin212]|nr:MAG: hypothetical protein BWY19_00230 [bacterium ADurb.Bin212]
MNKWKTPPVIKIYEALGAIADGRISVNGDRAEVYSSDGNKKYDVIFCESENAIMANDNGSYWVGYLGYPSVAYLMLKGVLEYKAEYGEALKNIKWKEINTKNKNNFELTQEEIDKTLAENQVDLEEFYCYLNNIIKSIGELGLNYLGKKKKPPTEKKDIKS